MAKLSDLASPLPTPAQLPGQGTKIVDMVAQPGIAPLTWQTATPSPVFQTRFQPVDDSPDLQRIKALPRRAPIGLESAEALALVDMISRRYSNGRLAGASCECAQIDPKLGCVTRLLPLQAWMLYEMGVAGGLIAAAPVGGGKTFVDLLAIFALGVQNAMLLIPSNLAQQLWMNYRSLSQHFVVPNLRIWGKDEQSSQQPPWPDGKQKPVLHVVPYEILQQPRNSGMIDKVIMPDAIISDECDRLRTLSTSTMARVIRRFASHEATKFCGWTGSLTDSKLTDYGHLAALALREFSPLPVDIDEQESWGRALDAVPNPADPGALLQLCAPGESVHSGFRRRLSETRGMIIVEGSLEVAQQSPATATGAGCETGRNVALTIRERAAPPIPPDVQEMLKSVRDFVRPDGEELLDPMSVARCAIEVACGFYYRWIFPRGEAESLIVEWLEARKAFFQELRRKLMTREEYLDSPHLAERAAQRHFGILKPDSERPTWHSLHYMRWHAVKDSVKPKTDAVRVSDYLVTDAAEWGTAKRGIVWYCLKEFGKWVHEVSGLPLHEGGPKAGQLIAKEDGSRSIVASLNSHGRGRDGLQRRFSRQLVTQPPSSATKWQQGLGRLLRRGQTADSVETLVYGHTPEFKKALKQAMRRSKYVKDTLGADQLLLAAWDGEDLTGDDGGDQQGEEPEELNW